MPDGFDQQGHYEGVLAAEAAAIAGTDESKSQQVHLGALRCGKRFCQHCSVEGHLFFFFLMCS